MSALTRRRLLSHAGGAAAGVAVGVGASTVPGGDPAPAGSPPGAVPGLVAPYGPHQVALGLPGPEVVEAVALDLHREVDRRALGTLLRSLTGSIESLTAGRGALGDPAPWLADAAARLTVTVGLGEQVVGRLVPAPPGFGPLPPLRTDRLDAAWSGGDLLVLVGARDGTTAAHAVRRLVADAAPFAEPRWRQAGSWNSVDAEGRPITGRNLFGQVDGTANPVPGTDLFDTTVWIADGPWAGGTTVAVRRIRLDLDTWDTLTRQEMEQALGRRLSDGAPLTGDAERDLPDLTRTAAGRPVIAADAHVRLAHPSTNGGARIFRRGANYVTATGGRAESGLLFQSYQADLRAQLVPILRRLDQGDALNRWTTTVGSAAFAVLPGFERGGWLGEPLLGGNARRPT